MFRFISIAIAASFLFFQNSYSAEISIDHNTEASANVIKKDVPVMVKKQNVEKKVIKKDEKVKAIKKDAKPMKKETKVMKKGTKKEAKTKVSNKDDTATLGGFYDPKSNTVFAY